MNYIPRKIKSTRFHDARTAKQWARFFFAELLIDHPETVNEYLDTIPSNHRNSVLDEMKRMAKMITTRKGYEWA